jgi:hypothetical protein
MARTADQLTNSETLLVQALDLLANSGSNQGLAKVGGTIINRTFSGSGATTFTALTDAPSSYTGQTLKVVRVNAAETALEFFTLSGGGDALTSNPLSQFAATTSLQLKGVMSDETGSGALVFADTPNLVTPVLGVATATSINKVAITAPATSATLTIANGKTLTASNTITFTATDGSTLAIGAGGTLGSAAYTASSAYEVPLTFSTGLTRSTNTITVNTTQNIAKLSNLTSNGFVKTSGGDGTLSIDTNTYLTSLTGAVLTDQTVGQTIGATGARLTKLWATDIESTNAPTVSGSAVYYAGGTDVALADGGTGASLADPNADSIMFWDDSAGAVSWLTAGSGLTITGTTITATGGSGITVGSTTITSGTNTRILYNNSGVVGEYTLTGTGTVVAMQTAPAFLGTSTFTNAGNTATFINNTDSASVQVARFEGDRATPGASGDEAYQSLLLSNDAGTQTEFARITCSSLSSAAGTEVGELKLSSTLAGVMTLGMTINPIGVYIDNTALVPTTDNTTLLGASSNGWADLYLASTATLRFGNTNWVATHSSGILTVGTGDLRVTNAGTNSASVVTVGGTQTLTNKTLTSPTLTTPSAFTTGGTITLAENTTIALDPAGSADGKYTGITVAGTAGYTQAFGDLVYLDPTDSRWEAVDANAASGADGDARGLLGMVVVAGTDGNACTILLHGIIRADAKFPSFTINNPIYASETAGSVTQTQPTTTDVVIRVVGFALTADEMFLNPSSDYTTHT